MPEPAWNEKEGTVTLVKGEDTKTFDLNKEDDRLSIMKMGQRGWYFDDDASKELGQLRTVVKNWDSAIEAAKGNDEAMEQLINKLELAVGKKLTVAEKQEIQSDPKILFDDDENSKLMQTIESLNKKIETIQKSQIDFKKANEEKATQDEVGRLNKEADALEKKYNGKDKAGKDNGTPKYEREQVFKYAAENNISNLDLAFKMMNYDKLTEASQKKAISDYKKQTDERKNSFVETGDSPDNDLNISSRQKAKSYRQLGQIALKDAKEKGLSLFTED